MEKAAYALANCVFLTGCPLDDERAEQAAQGAANVAAGDDAALKSTLLQ
jgi:hypothetical protein